MSGRYFTQTPIADGDALLQGPEAHHLAHVMRAAPGDRVVLFDGTGAEFDAEVRQIGRGEVRLAVLARRAVDRELPYKLTLGVALPKGDRQRWLAEKATELGVSKLVPLVTERSAALPRGRGDRLERAVIEASKQCGRNRLMEIGPPEEWAQFVERTREIGCRLLAHPPSLAVSLRETKPQAVPPAALDVGQEAILAAGPEGGFSPGEVDRALHAGWRTVDLGPRTLRTETAAIFLVALIAAEASGI